MWQCSVYIYTLCEWENLAVLVCQCCVKRFPTLYVCAPKATHVDRPIQRAVTNFLCTQVIYITWALLTYTHARRQFTLPQCAYPRARPFLFRLCHRQSSEARDTHVNCACAIAKEPWYLARQNGAAAQRKFVTCDLMTPARVLKLKAMYSACLVQENGRNSNQ